VADGLAHPEFNAAQSQPKHTIEDLRAVWKRMENGITRALDAMERAQNRLSDH